MNRSFRYIVSGVLALLIISVPAFFIKPNHRGIVNIPSVSSVKVNFVSIKKTGSPKTKDLVSEVLKNKDKPIRDNADDNSGQKESSSSEEILSENLKNEYMQQVFSRIAEKKYYPEQSRRFRQQGSVKVLFYINRDGSIFSLKVIEGCKYNRLNIAAKEIVAMAAPFSRLPEEYSSDSMEVVVNIKYSL